MPDNEKFLSEMRDAVKAHIEADPYFDGIEVVSERIKDIQAKLDEKLAVLGGIAIVLVTPAVGEALVNVTGANFRSCQIVARVLENVDLNETGKEALDVAIYLAALLSQVKPDTLPSALVLDERPITLGNDPQYLSYDVSLATEGGTKLSIPRLASPACNASNLSAVTLSHATPGAAIFHTLDGTAPVPRNPAAQLFQTPFSASANATLRARAWLAGYIASPELKQTL